MSKQDLLKLQSCILKVNIHCDGCEQKVKKLLQKIDGVYAVNIDAEEGKVLVAGNVDPAKLIKKLKRSGKHAEIWGGGQRGIMNNQNYPISQQFQNLQVADYSKGGKDNKQPQNHKGQKVGGVQGQLAHFQNVKGAQDLKVPSKQPKSVKFNLPEEEFYGSDDYGSDEFDDYDDDEEEEEGYGHSHPVQNKMMPVMGNGGGPGGPGGVMNGPAMNNHHKGKVGGVGNYGNGSDKKGDVIMEIKGKDGNYMETQNGNKVGKKSNEDLLGKNHIGEKEKRGGGGDINKKKNGKSEGGLLGRFLGLGKKSKKEGGGDTNKNKIEGGTNKGKEDKIGGGKLKLKDHSISNNSMSENENEFDFLDYDIPHDKNSKSGKGSNGKVNGNVGQMGVNHSMNQMGNIPAVQGLPAMNGGGGGGYYQGMQMQPPPHNYLQQQQYMAMMMNHEQQQHQQSNMYPQAMMYGRPHPSMNYMPPPPMPSHPRSDPITHTFSDENVESCIIM